MLGYQLISDVTVSGSAVTSVNFTGLNITKDDDYMLVSDFYNPTGSVANYFLFANANPTAGNYYRQFLSAGNTTISASRNTNADMGYGLNGGKAFGIANIKLTNSGYYIYQSNITDVYGGALSGIVHYYGTSTFTATSITQLTVSSSVAGSIGIGSRFQLYKCVATKVADITVGTATTSVDITGLNIDKTSEYMLVSDVSNPTASSPTLRLFCNNNVTETNYYTQILSAGATTLYAGRINYPAFNAQIANGVATSITQIKLTNNGYFNYQSNSSYANGGSSIYIENYYSTSTFTATSITQLTITSNITNSIGVGSRFQLYKLK